MNKHPADASHAFPARQMLRFVAVLGILNLAWEIVQLPLYTLWREGTWARIGFAIAHCTIGDVLIALICALAALLLTGWQWPQSLRQTAKFLGSFVALAASYTVFSEWLNTSVRVSWSYSDLMPVIPPLGTGVSPLVQWITLPVLAMYLGARK